MHNDIVKTFKVSILHYSERVHEMHDLAKYLTALSKKGGDYDQAYWTFRNK